MDYFAYYSRRDVQEALTFLARSREVQVWYGYGPGSRPDIVCYPGDVFEFAKKGMVSFHVSEERWTDPLTLKPGMAKKELDVLRSGWDLVLDIDGCDFEMSRIVALLLVRELEVHGIIHYSVKFSGNKGFHLGVCFEAFPDSVGGVPTRLLFPEGLRTIAAYLCERIRSDLRASLLSQFAVDTLCTLSKKPQDTLFPHGILDPFLLVDIDTVLISSRHLFRAAYSLNEKSGLVSIPVHNISQFQRDDACVESVVVTDYFLDPRSVVKDEAKRLLIEAFDYAHSSRSIVHDYEEKKVFDFNASSVVLAPESYPPCIQLLLQGMPSDGRKRAVFLLIVFLSRSGKPFDEIKDILFTWNTKNYEPLREGYILSQLQWFQKQGKKALPPNCIHDGYYKSLGVCKPDSLCSKIKNPYQYASRKHQIILSSSLKKKKKD